MNEKRKPRATAKPRWEKLGGKTAQSIRNHLWKMTFKLDRRDQATFIMLEPFTADECDLLKEILYMVWKGEDTRKLLYKQTTGKSRPFETERNQWIAKAYFVGELNHEKPKEIRRKIAEELEKTDGCVLPDERLCKILQDQKPFLDSLRALLPGH